MTPELDDYMIPCLNKKLFGMECMGCGLQRSVSLIIHGNFLDAFYMYPAIYTLILFFGVILINAIKPFIYASKLIIVLGILNVIIIVASFIFKTFIIN